MSHSVIGQWWQEAILWLISADSELFCGLLMLTMSHSVVSGENEPFCDWSVLRTNHSVTGHCWHRAILWLVGVDPEPLCCVQVPKADVPTADLKERYPQIAGFHFVSSVQGTVSCSSCFLTTLHPIRSIMSLPLLLGCSNLCTSLKTLPFCFLFFCFNGMGELGVKRNWKASNAWFFRLFWFVLEVESCLTMFFVFLKIEQRRKKSRLM